MFELVLIICLFSDTGEECTISTSPKTADFEACNVAGNWMAEKLAWDIKESGGQGRVGWMCRKRGEAV